MTQDDLDISDTPLEARFAAIRETLARDARVRMLARVRPEPPRVQRASSRILYRHLGMAAVFALAVVGIRYIHTSTSKQPATHEYVTQPGQRATVTLHDGTRVMLNVATRLRVPETFGAGNRIVYLDGEAQFIVTHDPQKPFVVQARGTSIRDLATVFIVRAYEGSSNTRVMVRDGRVAVQSPTLTATQAVTVKAREVAVVASDGLPVITPMRDGDGDFSWINGELVLRQTPLGEALMMMSRWYGLEFRAGDKAMLSLSVSGRLPQRFSPENVQYLGDVIGAKVVRSGNIVTFQPRQSGNQ